MLRFDNRGVGSSSASRAGPYTTRLFADDAKALVDELGIADFHMIGDLDGRHDRPGVRARLSATTCARVTLACTYAAPGPFCSRMFSMWADMAPVIGVPFVMRDVTLWAFTVPFFKEREDELREFEGEMAQMPQAVEAYLAQLSSIQTHDTRDRVGGISVPTLVLAGEEDILIPVSLSKELHALIPGADLADDPRRARLLLGAPGRVQPGAARVLEQPLMARDGHPTQGGDVQTSFEGNGAPPRTWRSAS